MEIKSIIGAVIILVIGAVLLATMLPTALHNLYEVKTSDANQGPNLDPNGVAIATDLNVTNDGSVIAIWNLLPLFAVLAGMGLLGVFAYKTYR